jgi:hypothetical protein
MRSGRLGCKLSLEAAKARTARPGLVTRAAIDYRRVTI